MKPPTNINYNLEDRTSTLFFDDKPLGKYFLRGGICFPVMSHMNGGLDIQGFAVMCGQEISTGTVYVFEQIGFITIDNILNIETSLIDHHGLAGWFNKMWGTYFADHYFWSQKDVVARKYRTEIHRSKMIKPMPYFQELDEMDNTQADIAIWRLVKLKLLKFDADSDVHQALARTKKDATQQSTLKIEDPAMHALRCAVSGLERYPYYGRAISNGG